ncbi:MAG: sugar phosphate isomerase/epimerase [Planctomycetales bacterium]|jgi:D-psicose/D-tagatose/L-ribulose 3-epimerase|nr:sugar phosphate isomerase/epimerase [Planctomycetales bacterium]
MKYGMNLLLWATAVDESHDGILEQIKEIGYDGVEVPIFEHDAAAFQRLGGKLDELGLERTAVTVSTGDANPISPDSSVRAEAVTRLKGAVDMCELVGAPMLCGPYHSALGEFSGAMPSEEEWANGKATLREVADYAGEKGVTLVLEYLNRFELYFLNSAADCARFVREVDHPNLRMMYDTFHANIEEKDITEAVKSCIDVCAHVHISENDRSTPGSGGVDWDTSFAALKEVGYEGWMVVEAFGLSLPDLAAATKIWRRMYESEQQLATDALAFMKSRWEA